MCFAGIVCCRTAAMGNKRRGRELARPKKRVSPRKRAIAACDEPSIVRVEFEAEAVVPAEVDVLDLPASDTDSSDGELEDNAVSGDDSSDDTSEDDGVMSSGNRIVNFPSLQRLLESSCVCAICKTGTVVLQESTRYGLASAVELVCSSCGHAFEGPLAEKRTPMRFYDVNRRSAMAMRMIGRGRESLRTFCAIMDMPEPVYGRSYQAHCAALHEAAIEVGAKNMKQSADELLLMRQADGLDHPSHVAVSTDGTWMRRGYSSLFGVQTVISYDTLKVLDVEVLSKHCNMCKVWKSKLQSKAISQVEFDAWKAVHADVCDINTHVSSPAMETVAVVKMWNRSEEVNNLQYTSYIGDGDSKGFSAVLAQKPYGDVNITKEECVGHVRKRLGKNLRDLRQRLGGQKLSDGKPIGGRGRLTEKRMESLQHYYGDAIKKHAGDVTEMSRAIWASVSHSASTDDHPRHEYCPQGLDSWCGWQQEKAGSGKPYKHHDPLPRAVLEELKPVYHRLTDVELLQRCARSATQNVNESLNGMIWMLCPKESFCSKTTVETAVHLAVLLFNDGHAKLGDVLSTMGCSQSPSAAAFLQKFDAARDYHARRKSSDEQKSARKKRRAIKKGFVDKAQETEGVTYCAGGF